MVGAVERVDYADTFIAVADDCRATSGAVPPADVSVAARAFRMVADHPYRYRSSDVIFAVYADRRRIPDEERIDARQEFYSRDQPCLRSSDLGRRYGWGVHADADGRIALVGCETPEYAAFVSGRREGRSGEPVKLTRAMRSSRAR